MRFATPPRNSRTKLARRAAGLLAVMLLAGALPASAAHSDATGSAPIASAGPAPSVAAKPVTGFVPGQSVEDVSKRTAQSKTFRNPDGSMTAQVSAMPLHFRGQNGGWDEIDNTLTIDGDGTVRNRANSFVARFGATEVRLETDDGVITMAPVGSAGLPAPVIDASAATVTYSDVWPGVDLRYQVEPTGIKEELVVQRIPSVAQFAFRVRGTSLARQADGGLAASGPFAGKWRVSPPIVLNKEGQPIATAAPVFRTAGDVVTLAVNKSWLASLRSAELPVVIDPSWSGGGYSRGYFGSPSGYEVCDPCQVRVGKPAGETRTWRTTTIFPYEQAGITGAQLDSARILLQTIDEGTSNPYNMSVFGGDVNGSYGGDWNWINLGQPLGSGSASSLFDFSSSALTTYYRDRLNSGVGSMPIKFMGDEASNGSYKRFVWYQIFLNYNAAPKVPDTLNPYDGWTDAAAPTLTAHFVDDDDANGTLEFQIDGGTPVGVGTTNGTASYLPTALTSGTHSWTVRGKDSRNSTGPWTASRSFTINTKPSVDPLSLSPADGYYTTTLPALAARYLDSDNNAGSLTFEIDGVPYSVNGITNGGTGSCTTANLCLPSSLAPGLHSWRVQAVDSFSLPSDWSPYQQFEYRSAGQVMREEYPVNGPQWDTTKWATTSGLTVSNTQGVFPAGPASKRATATGAYLQDSEVSLTYSIPDRSAGTELRTTLRGYGATGSAQLPNGYRLDIPSGLNPDGSTTISLKKLVNGAVTPLGSSFNYTGSGYASTRLRFRVDGSTISVKIWPAGTLEPTAWSAQRTDTEITAAGTLQIAQSYQTGTGRVINVDNITYQNRSLWGVDSVNGVDQSRLDYVKNTYGNPVYWGRYLHDDENTTNDNHRGLNREPGHTNEVSFIASKQIPVWVLDYNPGYHDLETFDHGKHAADLAIAHATALNIPKTVALFADMEPNPFNGVLKIDKDFIWGWWSEINNAGWKVGFYANPRTDNNFIAPFCQAVGLHTEMLQRPPAMWSQQPHYGRTREAKARTYQGENFNCDVYGTFPSLGWQYGIGNLGPDQQQDPGLPATDDYDTDLIKPEMADLLWYPGGRACPAFRGATCPQ